ncbi:MAG: Asp-tRNA(Asn)/Glu-tRNA(Gln) amidotransferase GatCAB subunit A [Candidatus Komeilibacteria bacterium CG11_big_fil_rev_8_21_14_0_20_36_20]|uniref:Glutamyl-tRNA(Gln) amidotransferase subunit A n=1 Tax=Candidatus Komeilibacteria bacterium CG11_big_fil_rev_8_21_14_0_20_36_20 TaxID=1974477 RepID=A0A2H0ND98_9BACT|nr:MAG: Asp-tRNA(Asn)/Glu-tRNA(Gln) amidotransferase GatCAB subunit A [Candidatus Komeilibacteria bacterium CG11_big_fil_rev_8_21_14_0_20_36_20]PIR81582.1 MAG: Asp-tRNA(Asn)/Glu-tRNA(Gln) amidotransferase GatCAB subunit A [Candidatus Komeilibacteria bacterium CG10_big_fil_rev_8_21_14_0_10_36_65]PJC55420.1 MAG: Asp-tRNA(Asn)/Glu-tRNA(Gln) amidotransferase GatCAB subunit A [Candidatus Komeilibacteria bacterium CG_4_9_14_0_2_um_filter_36_13]
MKNIDLENLNIENIQQCLRQRKFSSGELTNAYLQKIKADETNAFISINENAVAEAKQADEKILKGETTPLTGVPLAVKDIILVKGLAATAASKMLENYTASYTATAVKRLQDAGMVILGKTNCDEFAMGSSNENSFFGPVLNPYDKERVAGGSSGGSAAAVAGNLAPVALGTDTGGSIRQPASFCGVVGLKPTYGRISRYGSMAMASSLDQIGPLGKTVKDLAYLLQYMAGVDDKDATSAQVKLPDYSLALEADATKLRLGLPQEYFSGSIDSYVSQSIERVVKLLEEKGFIIEKVNLPNTDYALAAYYLLMPAEVSSNLARFDGLLYGLAGQKEMSLDQWYKEVRSQGFGAETKRRIILGTYILSAGYYDAYYKQAQKLRTLIKQDFVEVFKKVDVLITPSTPTTAFAVGEKTQDPLQMYLSDVFTVGANIAGICGLSLPIGFDKNNLPIGLQLLAEPFAEDKLFTLGHFIENLLINNIK